MDLVPCAHCESKGSCKTGCPRCRAFWIQRESGLENVSDWAGIVCSVCWGKGVAEPSNQKWQYRFPAMLALLILVVAVFLLLWFSGKDQKEAFDRILVFVSTLVGSVTGYYFGGERKGATVVPQPKKD
jgi:drug/metabolite transporter (DMT)-like permease